MLAPWVTRAHVEIKGIVLNSQRLNPVNRQLEFATRPQKNIKSVTTEPCSILTVSDSFNQEKFMNPYTRLLALSTIFFIPIALAQTESDGCEQASAPGFIKNLLQLNNVTESSSQLPNCTPHSALEEYYALEDPTDSEYRMEFKRMEGLNKPNVVATENVGVRGVSEIGNIKNITDRSNTPAISTLPGFTTVRK